MKGDRILIEEKCKELRLELIDDDFDYDKNRNKVFKVKCLKCGKISTKSFVTLVKYSHGCKYCRDINRDYHNTIFEVMPKILSACKECNYEFIGFCNGKWKSCRSTKLILKCNECGKITEKNYDNFINKKCKCVCYRYKQMYNANVLNENEVYRKIEDACKENNFTFVKFLSNDLKYHNNKTILELECNKCHQKISYTFNHFTDRKNVVCKHCAKSSLETQLKQKLIEENITFEEQKKFDWLGRLSLDFYLPRYNIAIECQGPQHFRPVEFFGGEESFKKQIERDKRKKRLCTANNVKLRYIIHHEEIKNIRNILRKK